MLICMADIQELKPVGCKYHPLPTYAQNPRGTHASFLFSPEGKYQSLIKEAGVKLTLLRLCPRVNHPIRGMAWMPFIGRTF